LRKKIFSSGVKNLRAPKSLVTCWTFACSSPSPFSATIISATARSITASRDRGLAWASVSMTGRPAMIATPSDRRRSSERRFRASASGDDGSGAGRVADVVGGEAATCSAGSAFLNRPQPSSAATQNSSIDRMATRG
jgi:hypothetical protein